MGAMSRTALVILNGLDKDDPLWWPGFCADIADGGSIPKMLEANSITWGVFSEWLNDSQFPDRKERYDTAIAARLVYHKALRGLLGTNTPRPQSPLPTR